MQANHSNNNFKKFLNIAKEYEYLVDNANCGEFSPHEIAVWLNHPVTRGFLRMLTLEISKQEEGLLNELENRAVVGERLLVLHRIKNKLRGKQRSTDEENMERAAESFNGHGLL